MNGTAVTARAAGLVGCHTCNLLCRPSPGTTGACPRCGTLLHPRKPASLSRTVALVLAGAILYIPANLLPIMVTGSLGSERADTIISGVIHFVRTGFWPIALIIFTASVFVPLIKLLILTYLLVTVRNRDRRRPRDRTRLYRLTQFIGRWSMVDVFAVTILVALVRLGFFATVDAGPGANYFAGVVVVTMFAAETFDPRLIWDTFPAPGETEEMP